MPCGLTREFELDAAHDERSEKAREAITALHALRSHLTTVAPQADCEPIRLLIREYGKAARAHERAILTTVVINEKLTELSAKRGVSRRYSGRG